MGGGANIYRGPPLGPNPLVMPQHPILIYLINEY